jgi:hypothetical protein
MVCQAPSFFEIELCTQSSIDELRSLFASRQEEKTVDLHQAFPPWSGKILIRQFMGQPVRDRQQGNPKMEIKRNTPIL